MELKVFYHSRKHLADRMAMASRCYITFSLIEHFPFFLNDGPFFCQMLTGDAEASNNLTTNSPAGAAAAANNKMPTLNGATAPQQDADFTIISDGFNNKKTLANGLMDFAFLTANANQLHYALASRYLGVDRVISIVLISTSIFLQVKKSNKKIFHYLMYIHLIELFIHR
jgi:hypothetical protein